MSKLGQEMDLELAGLGIVFFSPYAMANFSEGEDLLEKEFSREEDVQRHIQAGDVVGFGTGSSGRFKLRFFFGYPSDEKLMRAAYKLRLGIVSRGGAVHFRDLYDLMEWDSNTPSEQILQLEDGIYHVTLCSDLPSSGVLGDDQVIDMYLQPLDSFPYLASAGVPTLCV